VSDEAPIAIGYADGDAASAATADASVARTIPGFLAGETLATAARKIAEGDRPGDGDARRVRDDSAARRRLLGEPLFAKDADRLARLRTIGQKEDGMGDSLVLAMMLETAAGSHLR